MNVIENANRMSAVASGILQQEHLMHLQRLQKIQSSGSLRKLQQSRQLLATTRMTSFKDLFREQEVTRANENLILKIVELKNSACKCSQCSSDLRTKNVQLQ